MQAEVLILAGFKGILSSWSYRCQSCRLQKTGGFWFFDGLIYWLMIIIPLAAFIFLGIKFSHHLTFSQQHRLIIFIAGGAASLTFGFFISKCYLATIVNMYLKHTQDHVPDILK